VADDVDEANEAVAANEAIVFDKVVVVDEVDESDEAIVAAEGNKIVVANKASELNELGHDQCNCCNQVLEIITHFSLTKYYLLIKKGEWYFGICIDRISRNNQLGFFISESSLRFA
jgi:hypothetical protein